MAEDFEVGAPLPEESSNRTFILVAGVLGGLLVLSMICLGLYALVIAPRQQEARIAEATEITLQNTEVARNLTQTALAEEASPTTVPTEAPTATPTEEPTDTPTPTEVVVEPTDTPEPSQLTLEAQTATAQAQATLDAQQQATNTPTPTPTALPETGFADEAGLPGLLALGAVLVIVVFVARRMRGATP